MPLFAFLEREGSRRVPLVQNGVGHLEAQGTLAGRAIRLLVDTGAGSTVVSLSLARELGLEVVSLGRHGGGAGVVQSEIFQLDGAPETDRLVCHGLWPPERSAIDERSYASRGHSRRRCFR